MYTRSISFHRGHPIRLFLHQGDFTLRSYSILKSGTCYSSLANQAVSFRNLEGQIAHIHVECDKNTKNEGYILVAYGRAVEEQQMRISVVCYFVYKWTDVVVQPIQLQHKQEQLLFDALTQKRANSLPPLYVLCTYNCMSSDRSFTTFLTK